MKNKFSIDLLLEATGATGQMQVKMDCPGQPAPVEKTLFLPCLIIGRDPNTDLLLDDAQVNLCHCYMQVMGGRLLGVDLKSRTGTHWERPKSSGWVDPGQSIRIGPWSLQFFGYGQEVFPPPEAEYQPLTSLSAELETLPDLTLEFLKGPTKPMTWRINRALTLMGRSPECGVSLRDASVSAFHGSLLRTRLGTWVIDLLGRGGICVNGRRVRWARLDDGDHLQLGSFVLRIRPEAPTRPLSGPSEVINDNNGAKIDGNTVPSPAENDSSVDALGEGSAFPVQRLDRAGFNQTVLTPLVNQFAAMQEHMIGQFQKSIMMMVDRFSQMHREQFGFIRKEVDRLHQLTEELQSLHSELTKRNLPIHQTSISSPVDAPDKNPPNEPDAETTLARALEDHLKPSSTLPEDRRSVQPPPIELPSQTANAAEGDVHLWIYQRMATIQRERQSLLKKITSFLTGR